MLKFGSCTIAVLNGLYSFASLLTSIEMYPLSVQGGITPNILRAMILLSPFAQLLLIVREMYVASIVVALIPAALMILYMG